LVEVGMPPPRKEEG
jgi:hypothetical protein